MKLTCREDPEPPTRVYAEDNTGNVDIMALSPGGTLVSLLTFRPDGTYHRFQIPAGLGFKLDAGMRIKES